MSAPRLCAIGLDVGGTKIAGGVVAMPSGEVLGREVIPTRPERGGDAVLEDAVSLSETLLNLAMREGRQPIGIGVGVPELVDPEGTITSAHNFDWRRIRVADRFARLAPAVVDSDVRVAAAAEALLGAGRAFRLFAYVTVGTGISHSLVIDGQPFAGTRGNALVLTSGSLTSVCSACGAVSDFVVEEFSSGPAMARRFTNDTGRPTKRAEEVLRAAQEGDAAAVEVVRSGGEALGNSIAFLVNVVDPEAVIIGGGLGQAGGLYWESLVASTRRHIWADTSRDLAIIPATLKTDAGLVGAATAAWRRLHS